MSVTRSNRGAFRTLENRLKELDGLETKVGWFPSAVYEDGTPVAYVAAIQENGATINHPGGTPYKIGPDGRAVFVSKSAPGAGALKKTKPHQIVIPPRPFFRLTSDAKKAQWFKLMAQGATAVAAGKVTAQQVMEAVGLRVAGDVAKTIASITQPPLAKATVAARRRRMADKVTVGNLDKPLVASGILFNTLTSVTEKSNDSGQ